jgi:hypothetical protein
MILQNAVPVLQSPTTLIVGIIVALGAIVSPFITAFMTNRNAARIKLADYAREDAVADKAALVAKAAQEAAHAAASIATIQGAKLDQIHTLVNSNLTAAMQDQLDARHATLALLKEAVDAKHAAGLTATKETFGAIESNTAKVEELTAQLADRLKQTKEAAQQLAVDLARKPS